MKRQQTLWVSLLEVEPLDEHEYADIGGAFVRGAVMAESLASAKAIFATELTKLGFRLIVDHDTAQYRRLYAHNRRSPKLRALARRARERKQAQFGSFHSWLREAP